MTLGSGFAGADRGPLGLGVGPDWGGGPTVPAQQATRAAATQRTGVLFCARGDRPCAENCEGGI